ncbi:redoxin domain-containing protein [Demequina salsinemoris]|uniref:redoxin domain-containing protein n=1 Tax=Demequina salsinemoris TaxID=577470 RepID=UPI000783F657|nr:redoxin domain-containing protein [Demequina salsinemoris]
MKTLPAKTLRALPVPVLGATLLTLAACAPAANDAGSSDATAMDASSSSEGHASMETDDAMVDDAGETGEAMASGGEVYVPDQLRFTATTLADGEEFDGASLAGQDALIWVWASWCPTCQAEAPAVAEAASRLPEGVALYGLPGKSALVDAEAFVATYDLGGFPHLFDVDGTLWANFGVASQPALIMIDDDGSIEVLAGATDADGIVAAAEELAQS